MRSFLEFFRKFFEIFEKSSKTRFFEVSKIFESRDSIEVTTKMVVAAIESRARGWPEPAQAPPA